jgi:predicted secreted Zn-dependent protease
MKTILCVLALAVLLPLIPLFSEGEIRDCGSEYYDIKGDNGTELVAQMKSKNKIRGGYFGYTLYNYQSKCKALTLKCTVRMPRWTGYATSPNKILKAKWDKFFPKLVEHEQGHVDRFLEVMRAAEQSAADLTCTQATKHYKTEYGKIAKIQKDYDAETSHGVKTGASFSSANFQGLAYDAKSGAIGFAFDQETKEAAESRAMAECKNKDCKFVQWANGENACVSLAVNPKKAYGYANGKGQEETEEKTLATCSKFAKDCKIHTTVCAGEGKISE